MNSDTLVQLATKLSFGTPQAVASAAAQLNVANPADRTTFFDLTEMHHVVLRAFSPLQEEARRCGYQVLEDWCRDVIEAEHTRITNALAYLEAICTVLEEAGCPITVMKSLDHWPDIGNDLDLYTPASLERVEAVLQTKFNAWKKGRTWGDRLAAKCNYGIPGLRESIEVHHRCLGQTGEHLPVASRFHTRRVRETFGEHVFAVPAPEERVIAATLQRMYRHFYIRVCDILNTAELINSEQLDYSELRKAAELGGIWLGVASYLRIVSEYHETYRGTALGLPRDILSDARLGIGDVFMRGPWIRVPVKRAGVFYAHQMKSMLFHADFHGAFRLSLLPPLASVARLAYKVTGDHSGIW